MAPCSGSPFLNGSPTDATSAPKSRNKNAAVPVGTAEFVVKNEEKDTAVLLEFQTVYNEEYADWTGPGLVSEGSTEGKELQAEAEEESADPSTEGERIDSTEEETAETKEPLPEEEPSPSRLEKVVYWLIGTLLFLLVVFILAALYRQYIENR